jgi:signal transduction histidine kinase
MRKVLFAFIIISAVGFIGIFLAFRKTAPQTSDMVTINDAVMTVMQNENQTESVIFLTEQLNSIFEDMDASRRNRDRNLQIFLFIIVGGFSLTGIYLYIYYTKTIIKPFRKLQDFAQRIAAGNLDIPLEMDRNNLFGAFTESFDLMREELNRAKENERNADRSKKELVASLSHDIKTPVASIKAVTELMPVKTQDEKEQKQLETIHAKAEQINSLITNMFHATLEELQALSVNSIEFQSTALPNLIRNADYERRVLPFSIPNCIILTDSLRLQQVFDNIVSNSYKYAGTDIEVNSFFYNSFLVIEIIDYGKGVSDDELPLLMNKFYRGKDSNPKSGYGLGLYISKYLLEQMSGELHCENRLNGFCVKLQLKLA